MKILFLTIALILIFFSSSYATNYETKDKYPACITRGDLDNILEAIKRNDNIKKQAYIDNKKCFGTVEGITAFVINSNLSDKVLIIITGVAMPLWVPRTALIIAPY